MLDAVCNALEKLMAIHQANPLDFLSERDLQAFLFMNLRESLVERTAPTAAAILPPETFCTGEITTSLATLGEETTPEAS